MSEWLVRVAGEGGGGGGGGAGKKIRNFFVI